MESTSVPPSRRGQAALATRRLGSDRLDRNMVIRCSDELYLAARAEAASRNESLSDYVRDLLIRDIQRTSAVTTRD